MIATEELSQKSLQIKDNYMAKNLKIKPENIFNGYRELGHH